RMPTIAGMRKRGYTPEAIKNFCDIIGVGKSDATIDISLLEDCVRNHLNTVAPRIMCVLNPVKVIIINLPANFSEEMEAPYLPEDFSLGSRKLIFSREIYIEREDFMEDPPKKFFRLSPGREVRLRYAYFIRCENIIRDDNGNITEIHCTYDPETRGGNAPDGRKVKATLHWVSANHCVNTDVLLYDRLFNKENPMEKGENFLDNINPDSIKKVSNCKLEPSMANHSASQRYQFERLGYFWKSEDTTSPFIRITTLKDTWEKIKNR
ncbi:MAG: glutamine--tRNA ligase, partial [Oligoflexia bacterium]|nr:glutamine--tRNA ligase [Oligoflexia bacterium]